MRVCPLLERATVGRRLPQAPEPWVLRECGESGFVYLENPPGYEALVEEAAWELSLVRERMARREAEPRLRALSEAWGSFRRRVLRRDKIAALARGALAGPGTGGVHILDVGCADGRQLERLIASLPPELARRCVPRGIEISRSLACAAAERLARLGGGCAQGTALDGIAGLPDGRYDLILLASFLEHELQPLPVLRRCRALLAGQGRVIVKVPNYACWNRRLRGARWCGYRWPDHVNYFTPRTLRAMAERAGLRVARMKLRDRHPLSDSLYAVLAAAAAAPATAASASRGPAPRA